jgi:hypothetical protein
LDGGGEFVRDAEIEAEIIDALSEIISLTGVSGRMAEAATDRTAGVDSMGVEGVSVLGVDTSLRVFGAARVRGDGAETGVGVGSAGKAESRSAGVLSAADGASTFLIWAALVAAAMFRMPGTGRFSCFSFLSTAFSRPFSVAFASDFGTSLFSGAGAGADAIKVFSFSSTVSFTFSAAFSCAFFPLDAAVFLGTAFG